MAFAGYVTMMMTLCIQQDDYIHMNNNIMQNVYNKHSKADIWVRRLNVQFTQCKLDDLALHDVHS